MAGHVFVVHGDLTHLACDHWLLPSDRGLTLTDAWLPAFVDDAVRRNDDGVPVLAIDAPQEFCSGTDRLLPIPDDVRVRPGGPSPVTRGRPWLLDIGDERGVDPDWLVDGVREWLRRTSASGRESERSRPLVGLPLVGTGAGGAAERRDEVLARLLPALHEHANREDVDVALVLNDTRDHAAAQDVRRRLLEEDDSVGGWDLEPPLLKAAESLAALANSGRLALFLGAGVGRAAGLPLWHELIAELLDVADVERDEREAVARLDVQDQAEFLANRLDGGGERLQEWLRERFAARPHALAHALLATLPVREAVTTNWDPLFEQAVRDTGRELSVLPYDAAGEGDSWLLKLHGDAAGDDDIVVRRSDYLRFGVEQGALAGVVQSLLFTRHMLFVGFSLVDDNFIRIADEVTRIVDRYSRGDSRPDGATTQLGTTLGLHRDAAKEVLWPHLEHLVVGADDDAPDPDAPARRLEIFLDRLSALVGRSPGYLLDERYQGLLSEADRNLADRLATIADQAADLRESSGWPAVAALIHTLGHPGA